MKTIISAMKRAAFALLVSLVGCVTTGPTPTPGPGPDVTDYSLVCQHLSDLGCPEGMAPECPAAFARIQEGKMSDLAPACLMAATTPAVARACGSVLCEGAR
jgi:hypothetical protein